MVNITLMLLMIIIPAVLFFVEYKLAKKQSRMAVILPVIVLCFAVIILYFAIYAVIMFAIYFLVKYLEKERLEKLSEIDKMNIQDLE